IEHRSGESAFGCHTHDCWLRPANIPKAQGRRGTTYPRAVPSAVRDWLGADHGTDRQRRFLIAPTTSFPPCNRSCCLILARQIPTCIYLDTYILCAVYQERGICVRNHCGAEPPRDIEPPGLVPAVGWRDRASAWYAAADRVEAPA